MGADQCAVCRSSDFVRDGPPLHLPPLHPPLGILSLSALSLFVYLAVNRLTAHPIAVALSLIPAILIALFGKAATPSAALPPDSTSPICPSLLIRPALSYRASKPLPMRVALLRGAYFPRKKPMIHPLVKKRQYRHKSPLKYETVAKPVLVLNYGQEWV